MKVKTLLAKAAKCKSQDDVKALKDTLSDALWKTRALAGLAQYDEEVCLENGSPSVRFDLIQEISEYYATTIRPEIHHGKLSITVVTDHLSDGKGVFSQQWSTVEGMDDIIEAEEDRTLVSLARQAKELAIANHAELIRQMGVSPAMALAAAKNAWNLL